MGILDSIKKGVAESGSSKGKILYLKDGSKVRVRFLTDMEDALEVMMHDSFDKGITAICQDHLGKDCPYCDEEGMRHRTAYCWPVWDYDAKEVKIFMGYANSFNPLPALVGMYEAYGTLTDRDYVITQTGKGTNKQFSVVPMDKVKFKNPKAKPYPEKKLLDLLDKAYPVNDADKPAGKKGGKGKGKQKEEEPEDDEEIENDYESLTPKELYLECIERGLTAKKKQKASYYIDLLEKDDEKGEDEEWEEDEEDEDGEW
jgi:hypothetical protein